MVGGTEMWRIKFKLGKEKNETALLKQNRNATDNGDEEEDDQLYKKAGAFFIKAISAYSY